MTIVRSTGSCFLCYEPLIEMIMRPKKKGLFALLAWKLGGSIGQFFFFFSKSGHRWYAISFMCVHSWAGRPSKLVWSWVGRYCIPLYLVKILFWVTYYIFWHHFISSFLFRNTKLSIKKKKKKKKKKTQTHLVSVGKGQTNIFLRPNTKPVAYHNLEHMCMGPSLNQLTSVHMTLSWQWWQRTLQWTLHQNSCVNLRLLSLYIQAQKTASTCKHNDRENITANSPLL